MSTYDKVKDWNQKVNNLPSPVGTAAYYRVVENQFLRIQEELNELYEAIVNKDLKGIVDAGLDLDIVVSGFNYLSGSDYSNGINSILDNNDLKWHTDKTYVEQWKFYWDANGVETEVQESEVDGEVYYSLHRLEDNKVMKFANFPEVDLSSVVPEAVPEKYILRRNKENITELEVDGLPVLFVDDLDDEQQVLINLLDQAEKDEVVLTILNGSLVSVDEL